MSARRGATEGRADAVTAPVILPPLADRQWSLDTIVMGPRTRYNVQGFSFGGADYQTQDARRPGTDGERHGVDTLSGRTITLDLNTDAYTEDEGLAWNRALSAAWDAERVRRVPGATQVLRWRRGGRVLRAYGRSREYLPDHGMDWTGNIGATATFRSLEPRFYADDENREDISFVPDTVGGMIGDLTGDLIASGLGVSDRGFIIGGDCPTWIAVAVYGPISFPTIVFESQWFVQLDVTLGVGEYVLIDPTPWGGPDVRRSDGANYAGRLTPQSRILTDMRLAPGGHMASLLGADPTGTSRASIYWRDCYTEH